MTWSERIHELFHIWASGQLVDANVTTRWTMYGASVSGMVGVLVSVMQRDGADIAMVQGAFADALDQHHHATQWIGADDARIGGHPVVRMELALLGGEQREG